MVYWQTNAVILSYNKWFNFFHKNNPEWQGERISVDKAKLYKEVRKTRYVEYT